MLSLSGVTGRTAAAYYEKDDYYFRQSGTGEIIAGYERTGKYALDLQGFQSLVLERTERITYNTRLADDLTFSAPKSLSLLVALDNKNRDKLIRAHQEAVRSTINYIIESGMVQTRDAEGKPCAVDKNSVVALRFDHFLSRNKDPQLHSHVLLVNSVIRAEDGKAVSAYLREIYLHKKDLGAMYRQELASRLEKLGYQVEWQRDGTFEIAGFTKEQLRAFSSRREEILQKLQKLKQQGIEVNGKVAELACKDTREAKDESVNPVHLRMIWEEKARLAGITKLPESHLQEKDRVKEVVREKDLCTIAEEAVSKQLRTAGFTAWHRIELEIAKEASRAGITTNISEIRKTAKETFQKIAQKYGGEVKLTPDRIGRERFTVSNVVKADAKSEIIGLRDNQYSLNREQAEKVLGIFCERLMREKGFTLSEAQKKMVLGVAVSHSDVAVVGRAGTGKTTCMEALKLIYESQEKTVIGVSYTGAAAKNLQSAAGIRSFTIDSLAVKGGLGKLEKILGKEKLQGGLLIVDEAGMVSADRASVIQEIADKYQMKICWTGDPSQTKPVGAGDPFTKFLKEAAKKGTLYELSEIHRQRDPEYKQAAYMAASGNFQGVIKIFQKKGWIHEMSRKNDIIEFAKEQYMKAIQDGKSILILGDTNKLVNRINSEIRYHLQQTGIVEKEGIKIQIKDTAGKSMGEKEFAKGDIIMFLRNNKELEVKNGERGIILDVDKNNQTITVHMHDGSVKKVNLKEYNYINYGYAMTVHKSQGQTVDRIIYFLDPKQATSNKFYVAITRGKEECHILTKDVNEILGKLEAEQKIDIAGWSYGRDENGKLQAFKNDVKDYRAIEDVKQTILDFASREIWYSLTPEQKEALVEGTLDKETLEKKAEEVIQRVGEWHPDDERLESKEVPTVLKEKYQDRNLSEEQKQGLEKEQERTQEKDFDPTIEIEDEQEKDITIQIDEKEVNLKQEKELQEEERMEQQMELEME